MMERVKSGEGKEQLIIQSTTSCDKHSGDRSIRMNSEVYRAIISALIQPNATKLIEFNFIQQMDNDPKHTAKATEGLLKTKKQSSLH